MKVVDWGLKDVTGDKTMTTTRKVLTMGLLNNIKEEQGQEQEQVQQATEGKKKSNSEYQKRQRAKALAAATLINNVLTAEQKAKAGEGEFATVQDALDFLLHVKKPGEGKSAAGPSVFEKLFGTEPKVGTVITAYDMLKKANKNFTDMNKFIKKWAEAGTIVEFNEEKLEYKLVKLA